MLNYALVFFGTALVAAILGLFGLAAGIVAIANTIAKLMFVAFLVLALVTAVGHLVGTGPKLLP